MIREEQSKRRTSIFVYIESKPRSRATAWDANMEEKNVSVTMKSGQTICRFSFGIGESRVSFALPGDLSKQTTVLCLDCGQGAELEHRNGAQIKHYLFDHARKFHGSKEPMSKYDVASQLGLGDGGFTPARAVPLVWEKEQFATMFSEVARANMAETKGRVCLACLHFQRGSRGASFECCAKKGRAKSVRVFHAAKAHASVILDDDESTDDLANAVRHVLKRDIGAPIPPLLMAPNAAQSVTANHATSSSSVQYENILVEMSDGGLHLDPNAIPIGANSVLELGAYGTTLVASKGSTDQELLERKWAAVAPSNRGDGQREGVGTTSERVRDTMLNGTQSSTISRVRLATANQLCKNNGQDEIYRALGIAFVTRAYQVIVKAFDMAILLHISNAPKQVTWGDAAEFENGNRAERDWLLTKATLITRGGLVGRILKVICVLGLVGHGHIRACIEAISARLDAARASGSVCPVIDFIQQRDLETVQVLLLDIVKNPTNAVVPSIMAAFAFRVGRDAASDDDDESFEAEEALLESHIAPAEATGVEETLVTLCTVSQGLEVAKSFLHALKLAIGMNLYEVDLRLTKAVEQHRKALDDVNEMLDDIRASQYAPMIIRDTANFVRQVGPVNVSVNSVLESAGKSKLDTISGLVKGKPALVQIVTLISKLKSIESSRPSIQNNIPHTADDADGPVFSISGSNVNGAVLATAGRAMLEDLSNGAVDCLDAASRDWVRDVHYNPESSLLRLEVSALKGASPRLAEAPFIPLLNRSSNSRDLGALEAHRKTVFAAIYAGSGFTGRSSDLRSLDLGTPNTPGNVIVASHETSENGGSAIPYGLLPIISSKSNEFGVGTIPSCLMVGLLFLQNILLEVYLDTIVHNLLANIKDDATRQSVNLHHLRTALREYLGRFLAATTGLIREALSSWKDAKGTIQIERDTSPTAVTEWKVTCTRQKQGDQGYVVDILPFGSELFAWLGADDISSLVVDIVGRKWLNLDGELSYAQLRQLFVNLRANSGSYVEAMFKDTADEDLNRYASFLRESEKKSAELFQRTMATHSTGLHSMQTMIQNYASAVILSSGKGEHMRIPDFKLFASESQMRRQSLMLRLPSKHGGLLIGNVQATYKPEPLRDNYKAPILGPQASIMEHFRSRNPELSSFSDEDALASELKRRQNLEVLNDTQLETMVAVANARDGDCILVAAGCGSGKTLSVTFPASCVGGITLVVAPYVALVESTRARIQELRIDCGEFNSSLKRYQASSWTDGTRQLGRANVSGEIVLCTTDAFSMNQDLHRFLNAARLAGELRLIIFDEAHQLILGQTYRDCMKRVSARLGSLNVPCALLSGTCPDTFVPTLLNVLRRCTRHCKTIRSKDDVLARKRVLSMIDIDEPQEVLPVLKQMLEMSDARRILVFCVTHLALEQALQAVSERAEIRECFRLLTMTSEVSGEERERCLKVLRDPIDVGPRTICFSTSILAEGPDVVVDEVFVVGAMYNGVLHLAQATSRAGRGDPAKISEVRGTILFSKRYAIDHMYHGSKTRAREAGEDVLKLFQADSGADLSNVLLLDGIEAAVKLVKDGHCGRVALQSVYQGKEPRDVVLDLPHCGNCASCSLGRWIYGSAVRSFIEHHGADSHSSTAHASLGAIGLRVNVMSSSPRDEITARPIEVSSSSSRRTSADAPAIEAHDTADRSAYEVDRLTVGHRIVAQTSAQASSRSPKHCPLPQNVELKHQQPLTANVRDLSKRCLPGVSSIAVPAAKPVSSLATCATATSMATRDSSATQSKHFASAQAAAWPRTSSTSQSPKRAKASQSVSTSHAHFPAPLPRRDASVGTEINRIEVNEWACSHGKELQSCVFCVEFHYPNHCPKLLSFLKGGSIGGRCRFCFEFGHSVNQSDRKDKSGFSRCQLIVSKSDREYQHLGVCTMCWVPHKVEKCPIPRNAVRSCILWLANKDRDSRDKSPLARFRVRMRQEGLLDTSNELDSFEGLTRWCVFSSNAGIPNSYRLMSFVKNIVKAASGADTEKPVRRTLSTSVGDEE